jgi:HNH endonuclease
MIRCIQDLRCSAKTALIPLTQKRFVVVDTADIPTLEPYRWTALRSGNTWYAKAHVGDKTIYMHRLILFGEQAGSDKRKVDHANGDGLDNRRENLRPVTHSQNMQNSVGRKAARKSRFKGVSLREHPEKPYRACIEVGGRQIHLGYFVSECDAADAYNSAAELHFGAHARVNEMTDCRDERKAA